MTFGEKLQQLRTRAGLSQDALAEALDVSRQAVSKWERDEAMPEAEKLVRISRRFRVSTDYLLLEELEAPETAGARHADAGLWARVRRWYQGRGYLLAWVLVAWGAVRGLREIVGLAADCRRLAPLNDFTPGEWAVALLNPVLLQLVPAALLAAAGAALALRGRRMAGRLRWYHLGWLPVLTGLLGTGFAPPWMFRCLARGLVQRLTYVLLAASSGALRAHENILWAGLWGTVVCLLTTAAGLAILLLGRRRGRKCRPNQPNSKRK